MQLRESMPPGTQIIVADNLGHTSVQGPQDMEAQVMQDKLQVKVDDDTIWVVTLENGKTLQLTGEQIKVVETAEGEEYIEIPEECLAQAGEDAGQVVEVKVVTNTDCVAVTVPTENVV